MRLVHEEGKVLQKQDSERLDTVSSNELPPEATDPPLALPRAQANHSSSLNPCFHQNRGTKVLLSSDLLLGFDMMHQ